MNIFKSLWKRMFQSKWEYSECMSMRMHKVTGKVEYWWNDSWGGHYWHEPQFSDSPRWEEDTQIMQKVL